YFAGSLHVVLLRLRIEATAIGACASAKDRTPPPDGTDLADHGFRTYGESAIASVVFRAALTDTG
ncbi:MAG: hypothetical protein OXF56_19310, partial [Rhodobacteraceae bacterium]|nr:hypothetical protein [Paracoccaceae bacterium]